VTYFITLMNSFNKTNATIFLMQTVLPEGFPFFSVKTKLFLVLNFTRANDMFVMLATCWLSCNLIIVSQCVSVMCSVFVYMISVRRSIDGIMYGLLVTQGIAGFSSRTGTHLCALWKGINVIYCILKYFLMFLLNTIHICKLLFKHIYGHPDSLVKIHNKIYYNKSMHGLV